MLRHYDDLGLLKPARVDPFTNYRYYSANQLPRLHRILALKDLGFSLEQIGVMLDGELSAEQLRGMLKLRRAEIAQRLQEEEAKLARVEARLMQIDEAERPPTYDVLLRAVAAQMVATIGMQIGSTVSVTDLFEELERYVAEHNARAIRPPLMIYHDMAYEEEGQQVEIAVPISDALPTNGRIQIHRLPARECMACLVHSGSYKTLPQAYSSLLTWIEANQMEITGPLREVFLRFGADQQGYALPEAYIACSAAEFVTELQIPVARTAG